MKGGVFASVLAVAIPGGLPASAQSGGDAALCRAGTSETAILARITGFKDSAGMVRVEVYSADESQFLQSAGRLRRIEIAPTGQPIAVCVRLPATGEYGVVAFHDRNGNGRFDFPIDGAGFSRNPKLGLGKPALSAVVLPAGTGLTMTDIVMNYRRGLGMGPLP